MPNSSATEKNRLLKPSSLIVAAGVAGALLWLTFHSEDDFLLDTDQPDVVSANYAELVLAARPEDSALRIKLVETLNDLGEYARARAHLQAWSNPDPQLFAFYAWETDALSVLADGRTDAMPDLIERLQGLQTQDLSVEQLQRLGKNALALQAPGSAAGIYQELAERDAEQRIRWLGESARWSLASGQATQAAELYKTMAAESPNAEARQQYLRLAFSSLQAANQGEAAAELLAGELDVLPLEQVDPQWLEQGVVSALQHRRFDLAERFIGLWRELQPESIPALAAEFRMQLAYGYIHDAWQSGQLLLEHSPQDPKLLKQMALLGEWTGNTSQALDYWLRLLRVEDDPQRHEHVWRLAMQLYDFDNGVPLLASLSEQRRLTDTELEALIYAHESRGTPEQAERWLRGYLQRYPSHRLAWTRLLQNLDYSQQYQAEAAAWEQMAKRFPLNVEERLSWAEAHWKYFDPQGAWVALGNPGEQKQSAAYWRLRAALAWELERDADLLQAYEQLLAGGTALYLNEEVQLVELYRVKQPRKALALLLSSWRRSRDSQRLVELLALTQELEDWQQLESILNEARKDPDNGQLAQFWASQGLLAERQGRPDDAERFYQQGLKRFPRDSLFCERLIWLYIEQGRSDSLAPLLQKWQSVARRDSTLWLPFAGASQMLNRTSQALGWYRLYLNANPDDWLVQAAYADALEAGDYLDSAQRLRTALAKNYQTGASPAETPQRYATWLRLLAASHSRPTANRQVLRWQDGSQSMLQLWFDQLLAQLDAGNQENQKDEWLAWARARGLTVERYDRVQEALRNWNRAELQRMLGIGELDPAQRVVALAQLGERGQAMAQALSALSNEQPATLREQLRRQAIEMHEGTPQGLQIGWQAEDFGGIELSGPRLKVARDLGSDWYADLELENVRYSADELVTSRLGQERNVELLLQRQLHDGHFGLTVDSSWRSDQNRHGLGLSRLWQLGASDELEAGLDWRRESTDTGLTRALGRHDSLWLAGRHGFSARDQLSWSVAQRRHFTRDGQSLGSGHAVNLELNHIVQFEGPTWLLRSGVDYQKNALSNHALTGLFASAGGAIRNPPPDPDPDPDPTDPLPTVTPRDLLQKRYGQLYIGSSWRRGFPGALNRTRGQYTWLVDVMAGWQWSENSVNYGINTGVGTEVFGDDELALMFGYQSAPQGGEGQSGGVIGANYSLRFGR